MICNVWSVVEWCDVILCGVLWRGMLLCGIVW